MVDLPTIKLDTTLTELYKRASSKHADKHIAQVLCGANSGMALNEDFPRNVKYIYQDGPFNSVPKDELTAENDELRLSLAMKYLSLVPQRDYFMAGDAAVVLFNVDQTPQQIEHDKQEAERTIAALDPSQRPRLVFCKGPAHIPMKEHGIDLLTCKVVLDAFQDYPMVCDIDTHWFLNSKQALAESGLPTPHCEVILLDGHCPEQSSCCEACKATDALSVSEKCTGHRGQWLDKAINRVLDSIRARKPPYVVKNQQTYGGAGTYIVKNDEDRTELLKHLSENVLRKLFPQVTAENEHLKPGTVLISDIVTDIKGDYGITFFVTESGDYIYLAAAQQITDDSSAWVGSTIEYRRQGDLEKKFAPVLSKVAKWLGQHGYVGPAGIDVLETGAVDESNKENSMQIVDLNVRTSGSICLPLLRGHFESRGFVYASSFSITISKTTRDDFIKEWAEKFSGGEMCILSWYEDKGSQTSIADIAIGGTSEEELQKAIDKIKSTSDEVTF